MYRFGFIGVGHMGGILASAVIDAVGASACAACDADAGKAKLFAAGKGCAALTARETAERCKTIFLGVKPQNMAELLCDIGPVLKNRDDFALVTMAAGVTIGSLCGLLGFTAPVLRIMPNTPASVGAGCMLYSANARLSEGDKNEILIALASTGELVETPEELIDAGCAVSGCGPAFVYKFILALAKAGENVGLAPDTALKLAEQTVLGAAKLAVESQEDPRTLCDQVCSPGGSTIEGVRSLDAGDFAGEVEKAVRASFDRTVELGN